MTGQALKDAKDVVEKIREGDWRSFIRLQTMEGRDSYQGEVVKNVLYLLQDDKFTTKTILNKSVYLVSLVRYFGVKVLNNGQYFLEKRDGEDFARQYREVMASDDTLEMEDGERIRISEAKLIAEERIVRKSK